MAQELKAFGIRGEENGRLYFAEVYTKRDVDDVLAEKDAAIAELKSDIADLRDDKKLTDAILDERNAEITRLEDALSDKNKELSRQKCKRCLDKVKWCEERISRYTLQQDIQGISWQKEIKFYRRLRAKYLELAEKFKR